MSFLSSWNGGDGWVEEPLDDCDRDADNSYDDNDEQVFGSESESAWDTSWTRVPTATATTTIKATKDEFYPSSFSHTSSLTLTMITSAPITEPSKVDKDCTASVDDDEVSGLESSVRMGSGGLGVHQLPTTETHPEFVSSTNTGVANRNYESETVQVEANSKQQPALDLD